MSTAESIRFVLTRASDVSLVCPSVRPSIYDISPIARWSSKTCQLTVSDPVALRHSHVCLIVMNREQGVKDEILGVANFSLAEATW